MAKMMKKPNAHLLSGKERGRVLAAQPDCLNSLKPPARCNYTHNTWCLHGRSICGIDLAKPVHLIPVIGAPIGAVVNYGPI